jgi:ABC-type phosphate/phosphonate transport system substrate-binding protein
VERKLILGAVAYDPKVVTIWNGFKAHFLEHGLPFDYVLYSNYESQVLGQFAGHTDLAWNSPLAWIEAERMALQVGRTASAIAMRDTDMDLTSVFVALKESRLQSLEDVRGKRLGLGAIDSPQATLIPLDRLAQAGLFAGKDFEAVHFNVGVGLHGDHIGGERDAARALMARHVDVCCMLDSNRLLFSREGTLPSSMSDVIETTMPFDHCNFTALDGAPMDLVERFVSILLAMSFDDPAVRPLLELEGVKKWMPGRAIGYAALNSAVDRTHYLASFLA